MTPIEDLLREALASTPEPAPSTDPIGSLDRRVRRARRRLVAGAGVVAAVVAAAIVVPLAVSGGGGEPGSIRLAEPQTPTPSASAAAPAGVSILWTSGARSLATDLAGQQWMLFASGTDTYVGQFGAEGVDQRFKVADPADYLVAGDHLVWVVGGGDGGQAVSRISAVDPRTGDVEIRTYYPGQQLSFGAVVGDELYVDVSEASGDHVDLLQVAGGKISTVDSQPVANVGDMVATADHHVWVHSGTHLVELTPSASGLNLGVSVDWGHGAMLAPTVMRGVPDGVWAYDGDRLIGLSPAMLRAGVSVAEGYRVGVTGRPNVVTDTPDGGLYVAVPGNGIYFYSRESVQGNAMPTGPALRNVQVISMVADPNAGVDYVDDQGEVAHWQPVAR